ncbi:MAG TPA: DUF4266 domain-containing protein [Gammaproteobacteria bacterium]|nr:DUF4266 domain-containing protein [Gammaproteobacteria bacterium]
MKALKIGSALLALLMLGGLGGCASEPWVQPYEREFLADPVMALSRDPVYDMYLLHVYETREASQGGGIGSGGGCGCN